jgi:hypothetical protein
MSFKVANWPLVIDLDGTLIKTNSLDETFFDAFRRDPFSIWKVPIQLAFGRARLKEFLNHVLKLISGPFEAIFSNT